MNRLRHPLVAEVTECHTVPSLFLRWLAATSLCTLEHQLSAALQEAARGFRRNSCKHEAIMQLTKHSLVSRMTDTRGLAWRFRPQQVRHFRWFSPAQHLLPQRLVAESKVHRHASLGTEHKISARCSQGVGKRRAVHVSTKTFPNGPKRRPDEKWLACICSTCMQTSIPLLAANRHLGRRRL